MEHKAPAFKGRNPLGGVIRIRVEHVMIECENALCNLFHHSASFQIQIMFASRCRAFLPPSTRFGEKGYRIQQSQELFYGMIFCLARGGMISIFTHGK